MQFKRVFMGILAAGSAMAHMNMKVPPPLGYKGNPNTQSANIDYSITSPIKGDQYPCKGYLKWLGSVDASPVTTYSPGQTSTVTIEGGANHNGGSCQLSLSYDKGASFTVIKSFIGSCPASGGGTFSFTIPADAPEGEDVVFAWTWVNKTGNREFYMSCAIVNIKGGAKRAVPAIEQRAVAFASRPKIFTANLGGDDEYCTKEGVDTVFPDPGPDVETNASNPGPALICGSGDNAPVGNTGSGSAQGPAVPTTAGTPTGGIFMTTGSPATSTLAQVSQSAPTTAPTTAAFTSSTSVLLPLPTGGPAGSLTGLCNTEGVWNCVDGRSFQRCASGRWSVVQSMAAGTSCQSGIGANLIMNPRLHRVRRGGHGRTLKM